MFFYLKIEFLSFNLFQSRRENSELVNNYYNLTKSLNKIMFSY